MEVSTDCGNNNDCSETSIFRCLTSKNAADCQANTGTDPLQKHCPEAECHQCFLIGLVDYVYERMINTYKYDKQIEDLLGVVLDCAGIRGYSKCSSSAYELLTRSLRQAYAKFRRNFAVVMNDEKIQETHKEILHIMHRFM